MDVTRNIIAAIEVYLLNNASRVLPLFFPKNVSAPPAMDPDKPADLPDCKRTMIMMDNENIIWNIETMIWIADKKNTSQKINKSNCNTYQIKKQARYEMTPKS